jgi:hypothetical protein
MVGNGIGVEVCVGDAVAVGTAVAVCVGEGGRVKLGSAVNVSGAAGATQAVMKMRASNNWIGRYVIFIMVSAL